MVKFGTTGIRNKFSAFDPEEKLFTPMSALKLGLAMGTYSKSGVIVVGRDIRTAAIPIELAFISGLISAGSKVLKIGMVTTPTLAMSVDMLNANCGVMITASHNPPEYIGVKFWKKHGLGFLPEDEKEIERIYHKNDYIQKNWDELGSVSEIHDINKVHVEEVLKRIDLSSIKRRFQVIIDPGNGSACEIAPMLMNHLKFQYITINSQPDGTFPGRLSEPNSKNLQDLSKFCNTSQDVEIGIALDGDADRVVFVDGVGKRIEPIRVLTFLAREYIKENYTDADQRKNLVIVTPLNSSAVIEHVLEPLGVKVIRCEVGDVKVSVQVKKHGGFLGGENAGTYIWPEFHLGPDVLMTMAMILKYLSNYDAQFRDVIKDIPDFPYARHQYNLQGNIPVTQGDYENIQKELVQKLTGSGYTSVVGKIIDGLLIQFGEGWCLIRRSGTQPIVRISAESKDTMEKSEEIISIAEKIFKKYVSVQ